MYAAIDPGKTGAIVFVDELGDLYTHQSTPLIGREYDKESMHKILIQYNIDHIVLEDVHANIIGGKASNFDLGRGKGLWEGLICGISAPMTMVPPKEWQKEMWMGVKKQYKTGGKKKTVDTKATSLLAAKQLWPNQNWNCVSPKTGKVLSGIDDGLVDAALMAEYCRRKFRK